MKLNPRRLEKQIFAELRVTEVFFFLPCLSLACMVCEALWHNTCRKQIADKINLIHFYAELYRLLPSANN